MSESSSNIQIFDYGTTLDVDAVIAQWFAADYLRDAIVNNVSVLSTVFTQKDLEDQIRGMGVRID